MNLDSLSYTLSQITYLVVNLSKKNYTQSVKEIHSAIKLQGFEADRHLLRCLISHIDLSESEGSQNVSNKDCFQAQLLAGQFKTLLKNPSLTSILCFALDNPFNIQKAQKPSIQHFINLSKILHLSLAQEVVFGLVCLESTNYCTFAFQFLKQKLPLLIKTYIDSDNNCDQVLNGVLHNLSPEILHLILSYVFNINNQLIRISKKDKDILLRTLRRDFPFEVTSILLVPIIYSNKFDQPINKINLDTSVNIMENPPLCDLVKEMGYSSCSSLDECRKNLLSVTSGCDASISFSPKSIAKVVSMMIRTHTGLDNQLPLTYWPRNNKNHGINQISSKSSNPITWNIEVFINTINRLNTSFPWIDFIRELDHEEFFVKDRQGLILLVLAIRLGLNSHGEYIEHFPIHLIYRYWKYPEAQMSLIQQILENSDVFCFADYSFILVSIDSLKSIPEITNSTIKNWLSIELVDLLIHLAEHGLRNDVMECLKIPIKNCPDILALNFIESNAPFNSIRHKIIYGMIPIFLGNHINASIIFQRAWNHENMEFKFIIIQAMIEWYTMGKEEQDKLARILDIIHNLKGLTMALNVHDYPFIIDLACLASQRDYLNFAKWLSDKIFEQKEEFVLACVKFLQSRCPQLSGSTKDKNGLKYTPLSSESILTMLNCLQNLTIAISQELSNIIIQMVSICTNISISKGVCINSKIDHTIHHRPIKTVHERMFDQFMGVSSNFTPTSFPSVEIPKSPQNIVENSLNGLGNCSNVNMISSLNNFNSIGHDISNLLMDNIPSGVSKEVESEANSCFQQVFNMTSPDSELIDSLLEKLRRFKNSSIQHEREVYFYVLKNMFEECQFYSFYPEKELIIMAHLLGGIIQYNLVPSSKSVGFILQFILKNLIMNPDSKMYFFGLTALDRIKYVIKEQPQFCSLISAIPHFQQFPRHLIKFVEHGKKSLPSSDLLISNLVVNITNTNLPETVIPNFSNLHLSQPDIYSLTTNSVSSKCPTTNALPSRPSIIKAGNIDVLLVATDKSKPLLVPPQNVQDNIAFIFNNLSLVNIQKKCDEMREIMNNDYLSWLSQYLVMKRVTIEFNFHSLYFKFLDCLKNEKLNALVIMESFRNIRILLQSDKSMDNLSNRTLLKNLGHWLGMMTLAKNKPLLLDDINLKMLLVESYNKGQRDLLFIVPFITKILESCAKSKVFKPRNPWTMSLLNCLAELHQEHDLKLTLKFEIEVLCRTLNINIQDLKPGDVLKKPEKIKHIEQLSINNEENIKPQTRIQIGSDQLYWSVSTPQQETQNINASQIQNAISTIQPINYYIHVNDNLIASVMTTEGITPLASDHMDIGGELHPSYLRIFKPKLDHLTIGAANTTELIYTIAKSSRIPFVLIISLLKSYVRISVEQTIQEFVKLHIDQYINMVVDSTENIIKKNFGMNPDESQMRKEAHCIARNLTARVIMNVFKGEILQVITAKLKSKFEIALVKPTQPQIEMLNEASKICANDNVEFIFTIVKNITSEKAIIDIDKRLKDEYDTRRISRLKNMDTRYYDSVVLNNQTVFLPDTLQTKIKLPSPQVTGICENYAKNIPEFKILDQEAISSFFPESTIIHDELTVIYEKLMREVEELIEVYKHNQVYMTNTTQVLNLNRVLLALTLLRTSRNTSIGINIINRIIESYLEGLCPFVNQNVIMTMRFRDMHLNIIRAFQDPRAYSLQWTNAALTNAIANCREEIRFNVEAIDVLIRAGMLNIGIYDLNLAISMDNGLNYVSIAYVKQFLQYYFIDNRSNSPINDTHIRATLDVLSNIVLNNHSIPDGLTSILEVIRPSQAVNNFLNLIMGVDFTLPNNVQSLQVLLHGRDEDPPGFFEKTENLLKEWMRIYNSGSYRDSDTISTYIQQMNVHGIFISDDNINCFFRISTQLMVELTYRLFPDKTQPSTAIRANMFHTIDGYVKLLVFLIKYSGGITSGAISIKTNLLDKVLGIVVKVMIQDHTTQATDFHQLPYHRIFTSLLIDLSVPDPVLESIPIVDCFYRLFNLIQPKKLPGFSYAWLELISHRLFISRIFVLSQRKESNNEEQISKVRYYTQLLTNLFKFLAPFLRNAELTKSVNILYEGTLKVLLILLHDFPEFLCEYHHELCDAIPPNCIQLRNLILSAFPRHMHLPDPFTPNLKIDLLQDISAHPKIISEYLPQIQPNLKKDLDLYLKTRSPVTFLSEIQITMQQNCNESDVHYNIPLVNALVLYVGTQAIQNIQNKGLRLNISTISHSSYMDIFQSLSVDLDTEGRYLFLSAIANQLRYPSSHTHYFSCVILYLFVEANSVIIQEQITRVLLERIIVNKPHPWGLLITFIELIKNPDFKFWDYEFTKCTPEISKLLQTIARSCIVEK